MLNQECVLNTKLFQNQNLKACSKKNRQRYFENIIQYNSNIVISKVVLTQWRNQRVGPRVQIPP